MANRVCTFCGTPIEPGSGVMYVRKDGTIYHFCSRKCRINMLNLKHAPRNIRWTAEFHRIKENRKKVTN